MRKLVLLSLLFASVISAQQPATNGGTPAPTPVAAAPAPAPVAPKPPSEDFLRDYDYAVTLDRAAAILREKSGVAAIEKQRDEIMQKLRAQLPAGHDFDPQRKAFVPVRPQPAPAK